MSTEQKPDELTALTEHTEKLVSTLTEAVLATVQVAAERIELAATAARIQQRMMALGSVLEAIGVQKQTLLARLDQASGPMRLLFQQQIAPPTEQEEAVLAKAGVPQPTAQLAHASLDNVSSGTSNDLTTQRKGGKRALPTNGTKSDS